MIIDISLFGFFSSQALVIIDILCCKRATVHISFSDLFEILSRFLEKLCVEQLPIGSHSSFPVRSHAAAVVLPLISPLWRMFSTNVIAACFESSDKLS